MLIEDQLRDCGTSEKADTRMRKPSACINAYRDADNENSKTKRKASEGFEANDVRFASRSAISDPQERN